MFKEVLPNLFRIEVPLPENPLKSINSYIIKDSERNLVIDTGMNREECLKAIQAGFRALEVDLAKTDFFITHLHADHFGLVATLATDTSTIYFNQPDKEVLETWNSWENMIAYARTNGFPEDELRNALLSHPGYKHGPEKIPELSILQDGDEIRVGDYLLQCVATPGHTKGHICLYEPFHKVFFSGDHILEDITPNIQCWSDEEDPLKHYLASLDKVYGLEVDLVLPGHRRLFENYEGRIDELKQHHRNRLDEILSILGQGSNHAFHIASEMTWDIKYNSWDLFPIPQKWFATGEAIAHLRYLEESGTVSRQAEAEMTTFFLK